MTPATVTVGVSLKMYFGHRQSLDWCARVREIARTHPAVSSGAVELFVIPGFLGLAQAVGILDGTRVLAGAQDLAAQDAGVDPAALVRVLDEAGSLARSRAPLAGVTR